MNVFWREKPLSPEEQRLLAVIGEAHYKSSFRENPSSVAITVAGTASGSFTQSLIAALATLGGVHAPIEATYDLLASEGPVPENEKLPGWGTSFIKGQIDPVWLPVDECLALLNPSLHQKIESITRALHVKGKIVYPNPSCYTAATALTLGIPRRLSAWLFVGGRLHAWYELFQAATKGQ